MAHEPPTGLEPLWSAVRDLPLHVEASRVEPLELVTPGGWRRRTTVVCLEGAGHTGRGEDVTYDGAAQQAFQRAFGSLGLAGEFTLATFSDHVGTLDLFDKPPEQPVSRNYRRWALESAALDLALRQGRRRLDEVVGVPRQPVTYVQSLGLGSPPTAAAVEERLARWPSARFKLDWSEGWSAALVDRLAGLGAVDVVDFKGHYRGAFSGPPASAEGYRIVAEGLPGAWLEDPLWEGDVVAALGAHAPRVTWDAILHSVGDLDGLPFVPRCVNIKPSRFGTVRELSAVLEWCRSRGVEMYGGGQFELGIGRNQIQHLAALYYASAPNDVAPVAFHHWPETGTVDPSPLRVPAGFGPE